MKAFADGHQRRTAQDSGVARGSAAAVEMTFTAGIIADGNVVWPWARGRTVLLPSSPFLDDEHEDNERDLQGSFSCRVVGATFNENSVPLGQGGLQGG